MSSSCRRRTNECVGVPTMIGESVPIYNMYDMMCSRVMLFILHIFYQFPKTGTGGVVRIQRVRIPRNIHDD